MSRQRFHFEPEQHQDELLAVIQALESAEVLDARALQRIVRCHPRRDGHSFSKSQIIRGYRYLRHHRRIEGGESDESEFVHRVRMKPVRTESGVAPVTILTKPYPCPGKCIFCPNDVRMPKSYLSQEPGAQRAAQHRFDPYAQTLSRLYAFHNTGHEVDKVELIILGGTWSFYPEPYQIWFVKRAFDAMNDFSPAVAAEIGVPDLAPGPLDFAEVEEEVEGRRFAEDRERTYNQIISDFLRQKQGGHLEEAAEEATWDELAAVQGRNETSIARAVGLVLETRPDHISEEEVERVRRLGATKVQIGFQSLSDEILAKNKRGHDVAATRRAVRLLRQAGFKLHAHMMPNLHGSSPAADVADFERLFGDPDFRPDELKIYPCSLIESAELMRHFDDGSWRPYTGEELLEVVTACLLRVPPYCRVTRVIRDIPGDDIVTGNKTTNFREVAERELERRGRASRDIRAREIRSEPVDPETLRLDRVEYDTSIGREIFLQFVTPKDRLVGFLRLSLPRSEIFLAEIAAAAMIREVHVYGVVVGIGQKDGGRSQHLGLGRRLIAEAARIARGEGYDDLAVISSVGTREYYRGLGFTDGELYQNLALSGETTSPLFGALFGEPLIEASLSDRSKENSVRENIPEETLA